MKMSRWLVTGAIAVGLSGLGVSTASAKKPEETPSKKAAQADKQGKKEAKGERAKGKEKGKKGQARGKSAEAGDSPREREIARGEKARGDKARGEKSPDEAAGEQAAKNTEKFAKGNAKRAQKAKAHPDSAIEKELQKHAKRVAIIERLKELAKENANDKLDEKANVLIEKEQTRHERKLERLRGDRAPEKAEAGAKDKLDEKAEKAEKGAKKAGKRANQQ